MCTESIVTLLHLQITTILSFVSSIYERSILYNVTNAK